METFPAADARLTFTSGMVAAVVAALAAIAFAVLALSLPLSILAFFAALLALIAAAFFVVQVYLLRQITRLEYALTAETLIVRFGAFEDHVPLTSIQAVYAGADLADHAQVWRYWLLPGWWLGRARHAEFGHFRMRAVAPLEAQVALLTAGGVHYLLSPFDVEAFLAALRQRLAALPSEPVAAAALRRCPAWARLPLWRDAVALGVLGIALLINVAQFGIATARYPALPARVPAHFDASGQPDRYADKRFVLAIPAFAATAFLVGALFGGVLYHRQERSAALLVWSVSGIGQLLFAVALLTVGFSTSAL